MFLSVEWGIIKDIISIVEILSVLLIIPLYKKLMSVHNQNKKDRQTLDSLPKSFEKLDKKIEDVSREVKNINRIVSNHQEHYNEFEVQNLKYMINDAFFKYEDLEDIPNDVLINACECCDIYVTERNKNHEIRPRCQLLWKELEDRASKGEI